MWYVWSAILCLPLAIGDALSPGATAAAQLTTAQPVLAQEQPQPRQKADDDPQAAAQEQPGPPPRGPTVQATRTSARPQAPGEEEVTPPTGPMRIELHRIVETRTRFEGTSPADAPESTIRLLIKLTGERLPEIVAIGPLVVEEMIDDTGAVQASPEDLRPRDRTLTSPTQISPRLLTRGFINHSAETKAPTREARKLAKVSGWVDVIYATKTEDILIDNPLQYVGGAITHPRLTELGINLRVIQPGDEIQEARDGSGIALQFDLSRKKIRSVDFFDAWLRPLFPRTRGMETADGEPYTYYGTGRIGDVNEDSQILLTVYPEIEEARVPFSLENVELP